MSGCCRNPLKFLTFTLAVALVLATPALAQDPPECTISFEQTECGSALLCGPEGENFSYAWHGPDVEGLTDRCVTVTQDGSYSLEIYDPATQLKNDCLREVKIEPCTEDPPCEITGPEGAICRGDEVELCGPEGDWEYEWSGPGVTGETSRCVTVSEAGVYTLTVTDPGTKATSKCEFTLKVEDCAKDCPRSPGFWYQQALQRGNGSTKFSRDQTIAIAECISDAVDVFDWGTGETALANMLATLTAGNHMTNEDQVKRQFAALLANVCATGMVAPTGHEVNLSTSTIVTCNGGTISIGDLIEDVDMELTGTDPDYGKYIDCLDGINNSGEDSPCDGAEDEKDLQGFPGLRESGGNTPQNLGDLKLNRPYPNPFTGTMRMAYAVEGAGEMVDVAVFDLAGRRVQTLVSGFLPGGTHQLSWDGSDIRGERVGVGVYFVRGRIGDRRVDARILYVR